MPSKNRSVLPAYQRIQSALRKCIKSGELHPGDVVASERDLARIHQVSLMTARHALTSLEREGIVERRRRIGTFVAAPKIHFNKLMSYTEQMASRGLTAGSKVLFSEIIDNAEEATARLSLPPRSKVVKLERLRHAAGESFAFETCYLSAIEFPDVLSAPLERESLFAFLVRTYRVISPTQMRKLTPQLLIAGLLISSRSLAADLCSAFVRLSIQRKASRSCTCWASTDLTGTTFWSADSARAFRWWIWTGIWGLRQRAQKKCLERQKTAGCRQERVFRTQPPSWARYFHRGGFPYAMPR